MTNPSPEFPLPMTRDTLPALFWQSLGWGLAVSLSLLIPFLFLLVWSLLACHSSRLPCPLMSCPQPMAPSPTFLPQQVPWQSHGAEHKKEASCPVLG